MIENPIFIGVASGLLVSALLGLVTQFVKKVFIPFLENVTYKGIDVSGRWTNRTDLEHLSQLTNLVLIQKAHRIHGQVIISKEPLARDDERNEINELIDFDGEIIDRFVFGRLTFSERTRLGRGVLLLEVKGVGDIMTGHMSWYDSAHEAIRSGEISFSRVAIDNYRRKTLNADILSVKNQEDTNHG